MNPRKSWSGPQLAHSTVKCARLLLNYESVSDKQILNLRYSWKTLHLSVNFEITLLAIT